LAKFTASFREAPTATRLSDPDPGASVLLTFVLKPGTPMQAHAIEQRHVMTREQYRTHHGSAQTAIDQVVAFAQAHGMTVESTDATAHRVKVRATYAQAIAALQPDGIGVYAGDQGNFVARSGHLYLPEALAPHVVAVQGLDQRPVARPHFRLAKQAAGVSYTPVQVAARYQFPAGLDGTGQTIGIIELGGGYTDSDIAAYFTSEGVNRTGTLTSVSVDGTDNAPDDNPNGADGEVQLDIEVAGSIAPAANIAVYFGPNQGSGFTDAISAAVTDSTNDPSVLSISWGGPESGYSQQDRDAMEQVLQQAATLGITVCVASGDSGSSDGVTDGQNHVDFPASSPYSLGCGGTSLPTSGEETAWNNGANGGASGGGYSSVYPLPTWQTGVAGITGTFRGVPDVSGDADPATGYSISVDGQGAVIGGTSAVAPLWAGLIALVNQSIGQKAGFINPLLYANRSAFTDITSGDNGAYQAAPGWDPVTGLGSPIGTSILAALKPAAAPAPTAPPAAPPTS
jgi:kumamolisin